MKKYKIIILCVCICFSLHAQVGVNTITPQGILHIDSKGDTSGATNTSDDVIVMPNGRVGVGTLSPTANLDIRGTFRIVDGTEAEKTLLVSDANGVGSWKRKTMGERVLGDISSLTHSKRVEGELSFTR